MSVPVGTENARSRERRPDAKSSTASSSPGGIYENSEYRADRSRDDRDVPPDRDVHSPRRHVDPSRRRLGDRGLAMTPPDAPMVRAFAEGQALARGHQRGEQLCAYRARLRARDALVALS